MKKSYTRPEFLLVRFDSEDVLTTSSVAPTIAPTITPTIAPTVSPTIAPTATAAALNGADHSAGAYSIKGMLGLW